MTPYETDRQFMAEAIALARTHEGLTGDNPSVGALIVRDDGSAPHVIGRGVTALEGRPHAEPQALAEAGDAARGATAYVTLEPCAHFGRTPPCADALVEAGIARLVCAVDDPDSRVAGKGFAILETAGITVERGVMRAEAEYGLAGYLTRRRLGRAHVTLKLAVSRNGFMGLKDAGQVALTGAEARAQVHLDRAVADVILVGIGTALADDPELTVRAAGLEERSPIRLILDQRLELPLGSKLVTTARRVPLWIASSAASDHSARPALEAAGAEIFPASLENGRIALLDLVEKVAQRGLSTIYVEGGARVAQGFLDAGLVDRLHVYTAPKDISGEGVAAPVTADNPPKGFVHRRTAMFGPDRFDEFERET